MLTMSNTIEDILYKELELIFDHEFQIKLSKDQFLLQKTKKEFQGQFTIVVFPFVKELKRKPEEIGQKIGELLTANLELITEFNVVKGFLNLSISDTFWIHFLQNSINHKNFGYSEPASKEMMMVEYSSPNTNKPLHLGHLRNNFLGYSVSEILKANGHDVVKVQIINDRGIHICKSILAWQKFGNGETPESSGMKGDKLVGKYYVKFDEWNKQEIESLVESGMDREQAEKNAAPIAGARELLRKWEQKESETYELWQKMNNWVYTGFDQTYARMGVDFDKLYYESETYLLGKEEVTKGLESGKLYQNEDKSIWIDLTDVGLDNKLLLRSDGTAVYMTQDIGTAILRFKDYPNLKGQIYTVGNEQEYHFKALFLILQKLGFERAKDNYHLSYGMVELPKGMGRMKSREGTVVDADDLMDEMAAQAEAISLEAGKLDDTTKQEKNEIFRILGMGALKYFLLRVDPNKKLIFDPRESIDFNGNTGPFIQYTYTRINSLVRKFGQAVNIDHLNEVALDEKEISLLQLIYEFPEIIKDAAEKYSPAVVANYCYELVKAYNSFYQSTPPILKEKDLDLQKFRISLSLMVGRIIKKGMALLGVEMPDKM